MKLKAHLLVLTVGSAALLAGCAEEPPGAAGGDPFGIFETSNDDYFDGCQWSEGCGGVPGAWNGEDDNSLDGGSDLEPLG